MKVAGEAIVINRHKAHSDRLPRNSLSTTLGSPFAVFRRADRTLGRARSDAIYSCLCYTVIAVLAFPFLSQSLLGLAFVWLAEFGKCTRDSEDRWRGLYLFSMTLVEECHTLSKYSWDFL